MDRIKHLLLYLPVFVIGMILSIVLLPVMIILWPLVFYRDKKTTKKYKAYLKKVEGCNFFCYNNRQSSQEFIEQELLPKLPEDIDIVYLNGRRPESKYDNQFISSMLYRFKNYSKYPHLMKVRNGEVIDHSINNEVYNTFNQDKDVNILIEKINDFFERELA